MASQYDAIGLAYESMKRFPATVLERTTFQSAITPFLHPSSPSSQQPQKNIAILDLACGTGYYTRLLHAWGTPNLSRILGIDLSPVMVQGAQASLNTAEEKSIISFQVGDCVKPLTLENGPNQFDIVTGAWLLNYASDSAEMTAMWRNISNHLKPGGVFVGITPHPASNLDEFADLYDPVKTPSAAELQMKYGVSVQYTSKLPSGEGYTTKIVGHTMPTEISFENFHLRREIYERSAREGGMEGEIRWEEPQLPSTDEQSLRVYGVERAWWDGYDERMHCGIMIVRK